MAEAAAKEPSMEEILSSIRRIISEETGTTYKKRQPVVDAVETVVEQHAPEASTEAELQTSGETVEAVAEPQPVFDQVPEALEMPEPEAVIEPPAVEVPAAATIATPSLEANEEAETQANSISDLAAAIKAGKASADAVMPPQAPPPETPVASSEEAVDEFKGALMSPGATHAAGEAFERLRRSTMQDIDAKTEAILRPMLREWLDENLPPMVERLIRQEIERVARGS